MRVPRHASSSQAASRKRTFHVLIQPDISCANDTSKSKTCELHADVLLARRACLVSRCSMLLFLCLCKIRPGHGKIVATAVCQRHRSEASHLKTVSRFDITRSYGTSEVPTTSGVLRRLCLLPNPARVCVQQIKKCA